MNEGFHEMQSMDMKTVHYKQLEEILAKMSLDWWPYTDLDTKFTIDPDGETLFIRSADITTPISVDRSATGDIKSFFVTDSAGYKVVEVFTSWLDPKGSQFYNKQLKDPNLSPDDREKYEEWLRISKQQADLWINLPLTKIAYAVNKINTMIKVGSKREGLSAELSDLGQPRIIGSDEKEYSFPKDFVTKNMGGLINLTITDDLIYRDPPQLVSYINKRIQRAQGERQDNAE